MPVRETVRAGTWRKRLDSADERWGGAGARAPETLESSGEMTVPLAPWSVALLVSDA